jgi:hypothetical protein
MADVLGQDLAAILQPIHLFRQPGGVEEGLNMATAEPESHRNVTILEEQRPNRLFEKESVSRYGRISTTVPSPSVHR